MFPVAPVRKTRFLPFIDHLKNGDGCFMDKKNNSLFSKNKFLCLVD